MTGAGRLWSSVLCVLAGLPAQARAAPPLLPVCAPVVQATLHLPGRVEGVLPLGAGGAVLALAGGHPPRDSLLVAEPRGVRIRATVTLPPYHTLPGLALGGGPRPRASIVVDGTLWQLDAASGRVRARWPLDLQAVGWPAALAWGAGDRLYVAGQPRDSISWAAVVEALALTEHGRPRVLWRARLGLTHAGIWLGDAGAGTLAVYTPDANDVSGTIVLLDERTGVQLSAYSVPVPPAGADPWHDRLYLRDGETIRALTLHGGRTVATAVGNGPLAANARRGLVAFVRQGSIVLASTRGLREVGRLALDGVTALAMTPDGGALVAGLPWGIAWIDLRRCGAP